MSSPGRDFTALIQLLIRNDFSRATHYSLLITHSNEITITN